MKFIKVIANTLVLSLLTMFAACSADFLDVNNNPNDPAISTPRLTLPVAQQNFTELNATSMTFLGEFIVYNWATPKNFSANGSLIIYEITSNFYPQVFEDSYFTIFKDLAYIEKYSDPESGVDYGAYHAIAETIKGFQYQYLVDLYGDVPFTEANQRGENPTPAYDDAEFVYKSVIDSLGAAANLALNLPDNAENPESQDIIFGGNMYKWAQFANTIKLRMLVRLSNTGQDQYIKDQLAQIDANGAGYIASDVAANPGYSDNAGQQSPLYGYVGAAPNGAVLSRNRSTVATDYTIDYLKATNDPRMERIYSEAVFGGYKGVQQMTAPGDGFTAEDLSHVGPGLLKSSEQDQPIMTVAESQFLQAEAIWRGYIPGGESAARAMYESAISESFRFLTVPDAENAAQVYYGQGLENVSWDASPDKIEAIITQKWIALNGTSSIESWVELTRTGFPKGLPIPMESGGVRPVRLLYPATEIARNSNNVPIQNPQEAFTNYPFWK